MSSTTSPHKGIIAWFAGNPVAANLLMIVIMVIGIYSALTIQRTLQPEVEIDVITVTMAYPGAAPEEVERGVILKIEESLKDIESIERIDATADESIAQVNIDIHDDFDVLAALDEIKSAVDGISSFPEAAEKPVINRMQLRDHAMNIQVYGNLDERGMKSLIEEVKDELLQNPDIGYARVYGDRDYEIAVEIPDATLRKYQLTMEQVAGAIRGSSLDMPGGAIKSDTGEIMLRTRGQAYHQQDFEKVVLITNPDGTRLTLGDIATINDGFVEKQGFSIFDRKFSMAVTVYGVGNQDLIEVAKAARQYVADKRQQLPPGVYIDYWADITYYLEGRLDMMIKNLAMGGLLVFLILGLFLDLKLAFWVMAGLPVCFLGAFALMPIELIGISVNMISLFGFILVLGIVVDDAIIIGESANTVCEEKGRNLNSVVEGALRVATPATFGVLTTIVAFAPTLFTEGVFAPFPAAMGWVVILCLIFSLVESKWILPAHLAHSKPNHKGLWGQLNRIPEFSNAKLKRFVQNTYRPFIVTCIKHRYTTFATFLALLILAAGLTMGGVVRYVLIPNVPGDFIKANLEMTEGTTDAQTRLVHDVMAKTIYEINEQYKQDSGNEAGFINHLYSYGYDGRYASFMLELTKNEVRDIGAEEIVQLWREQTGEVAGAKVLSFSNADDMGGPAMGFKLTGKNPEQLSQAAIELEQELATYEGTFDIRNGASAVRDEITLSIKPSAEALGLSLADLGTQVRQAFYGAEAQRIQRGNNEIKVMVRYPKEERQNISNLENMYIHGRDGTEVPFSSVADIDVSPGHTKTTRINSERAITVSAQVNKAFTEPSRIKNDITRSFLPELMERYPDVNYKLSGGSEEEEKLFSSMFLGFVLALFGIYALLAIPLHSYMQPLIIMGVIPFGVIGAIVGHIVVGIPFDMMSFFGVIALSGVVVNDSLIMVDFVNKAIDEGSSVLEAVINSGTKRFRAILLTSLTTFFGLLPMLLETSVQAQMVIPMAVSLGFGIIFATVITLILVPCLYMVLDDLDGVMQNIKA